MRQLRSSFLENKENDMRHSNYSSLPSKDPYPQTKQILSKINNKGALSGSIQLKSNLYQKLGLNLINSKKSTVKSSQIKKLPVGNKKETVKIKTTLMSFKKSFVVDRVDCPQNSSKKGKLNLISERTSTEPWSEGTADFQNSNKLTPFNNKCFKENERKKKVSTNFCENMKLDLKFSNGKKNQKKMEITINENVEKLKKSLLKPNLEITDFEININKNEPDCEILTEHLKLIDKKFGSLRKIFGNEKESLNNGQLSLFLSNLGWINELDKNLEIQFQDDHILVDAIFEGANLNKTDEIPFILLRKLLATITAIFTQKVIPKVFEVGFKGTSHKMTSLSNKKIEGSSKMTKKENLTETVDAHVKKNIKKVQSCTSTPTQLLKNYDRFENLAKTVNHPTCESEMQFSFRKVSEKKPKTDEMSKLVGNLDFVDASYLSSMKKKRNSEKNSIKFDSKFLRTEEKNSSDFKRANKTEFYETGENDPKNELDFGSSIFESKIIETDAEIFMDKNFGEDSRLSAKKHRLAFSVSIQIGNSSELIDIYENDDFEKVARDFVRKHDMASQFLLVFEGLHEQYKKYLLKVCNEEKC